MLIAQIDKENEWNENARMIFKELYEEVPGVKEYVQSHGYGYLIWGQSSAGSFRRRPLAPTLLDSI